MAPPDDTDRSQEMHVGMLLRCFLCHKPLPEPQWGVEESYPEWQSRLVSVFPFTAKDGSVRQQLRSTHIKQVIKRNAGNKAPRWTTDDYGGKLFVQLCDHDGLCGDYCPECRPDRMIYLSHRDCWKVAFSSSHFSCLSWSRLAVQTRPFEIRRYGQPVVCHKDQVRPDLTSVPPDSGLFQADTPLAELLSKIRVLPTELQLQIMDLVRGTMFASLLQATKFVLEMLPRLRPRSNWTIQPKTESLRVHYEESSDSLFCCSMNIMGLSYLSEIALEPFKGSTMQIPLANGAVRGLQFALGRFGLRGVRISYEDESFSPWLGDSSSCWLGTVFCPDLSKLNVIADELRVIRVEMEESALTCSETSVMWYGGCPPAGSSTRLITPQRPEDVLHYYPKWRQCQYLPLSFGSEYASGLTVYMTSGFSQVIGIVSHGSFDFVFGEAQFTEDEHEETYHGPGIPIHFPLSQGEYLTSAWLHTTSSHDGLDGLLVLGTNLGRVQYFGAYELPEQLEIADEVEESAWVRLSTERSAKFHGLAFDVPEYTHQGKYICGFGVSQDASIPSGGDEAVKAPLLPIHARGPTLPTPDFTAHLRWNKTRYGFSTASLNNIAALHVRKKTIKARSKTVHGCAGLCIVHSDSTIEILGRWDPRDKDSISKIYDASEGSLTRLSFHMATIERATHVETITVGVTDNPWSSQPVDVSLVVPVDPPDHPWDCKPGYYPTTLTNTRTFDCSQSCQRIVWWYTFDYDDITRDHGSPAVQIQKVKSDSDLWFGKQLEAMQFE